jgi:hypothetical protein
MSRAAAMLLCAALAVGCSKTPTQVKIAIYTRSVRVPDDVARIHLSVADQEPAATDAGKVDDSVYDAAVELCTDQVGSGCYDLPLSAVLFPGQKRAGDSVRVQVDAVGPAGDVVTSDAALFVFSPHQSFQLDFVLYAACIGVVDCALRDQACGPDAQCASVTPTPGGSTPDLADDTGGADLAGTTVADLASSKDGAGEGDMSHAPGDMAKVGTDLAGCGSTACAPGTVCSGGSCVPCGIAGDLCCDTTPACAGTSVCVNGRCGPGIVQNDMQIMSIDAL